VHKRREIELRSERDAAARRTRDPIGDREDN